MALVQGEIQSMNDNRADLGTISRMDLSSNQMNPSDHSVLNITDPKPQSQKEQELDD